VLDSKGDFLVADMIRSSVLQFSKDGVYVGSFGAGEDGNPIAHEGMCVVAVDPAGRVFAADRKTGPPRVEVYDPDGRWLFGFAPKGAYPWMVAEPSGIAFHPDGRIFLADMDAMRVAVYDMQGEFLGLLREHAPNGNRFNAPSGLAVDPSGDLFVSSLYGPCEKLCARTAERIFAFAYPAPPTGPMFIDDVCVDRWGNAFLAVRCAADPVESGPESGGRAAVMKYSNHGNLLAEIGLSVEEPKRAAVAVDDQDRLYVAYSESDTAGVEVFVQE
jgi:sugar lactone lactonase YvrE